VQTFVRCPFKLAISPSEAEGYGHNSRWNPARVGVVIPCLRKEFQAGVANSHVEPRTQTSPGSTIRDFTDYLIRWDQSVEEHTKKMDRR